MFDVRKVMGFLTQTSVSKLLWGNGLANAIQFSSLIVLSRLYDPEDFGLLAQMQSISLIAATVFTMQLHLTIPLAGSEENACDTTRIVEGLCISCFGLAVAACIFLPPVFAFAAALSLFVSVANTYNAFLLFRGDFSSISRFYVTRACLIVAAQIGFAAISIQDGLLWATLLGEGAATFYLRHKQIMSQPKRPKVLSDLIDLVMKFRAFSLFGTVQEIISVAAFYAPLFLLDKYYGNAVGGQYAMANRLIWAPVALLASSAAQVLMHKYANHRPKRFEDYFSGWNYKTELFIFVSALCFLCWQFSGVFVFLLGKDWLLASEFIPLQVMWGVIFLMSTPFRVAIRVFSLQKWQMITETAFLCAIIAVFSSSIRLPLDAMFCILVVAGIQNIVLTIIVGVYHLRTNVRSTTKC